MNPESMILDKEEIPEGYNAVNPFVIIKGDAKKFIDFVEQVFDAKEKEHFRIPDRNGTLIHAEVKVGDASILIADSKTDWPFTPAFLQVYVRDAQEILGRAKENGAEIVTEVSRFYGGFKLGDSRTTGEIYGGFMNLKEVKKKNPKSKNPIPAGTRGIQVTSILH
jgi:uncharacterized glyoxalase superfamily protein PhnB